MITFDAISTTPINSILFRAVFFNCINSPLGLVVIPFKDKEVNVKALLIKQFSGKLIVKYAVAPCKDRYILEYGQTATFEDYKRLCGRGIFPIHESVYIQQHLYGL